MNISITREVESRRVLGNLCLVPRSLALSGGAEEALAANTASALSQLEFLLFFLLLQLLGRSIRNAANSPVAIKTRHNEYRRHLLSVCHTFGMGKFYSKLSLLVGLSFFSSWSYLLYFESARYSNLSLCGAYSEHCPFCWQSLRYPVFVTRETYIIW